MQDRDLFLIKNEQSDGFAGFKAKKRGMCHQQCNMFTVSMCEHVGETFSKNMRFLHDMAEEIFDKVDT